MSVPLPFWFNNTGMALPIISIALPCHSIYDAAALGRLDKLTGLWPPDDANVNYKALIYLAARNDKINILQYLHEEKSIVLTNYFLESQEDTFVRYTSAHCRGEVLLGADMWSSTYAACPCWRHEKRATFCDLLAFPAFFDFSILYFS